MSVLKFLLINVVKNVNFVVQYDSESPKWKVSFSVFSFLHFSQITHHGTKGF